MSIIVLPENHEAWLKERKYGLGGSDAAAVLGMTKWKSNVELWEEKVGLREPEDISEKPYVKYGHDAEPFIRGIFALNHPELKVTYESPYKMIRHSEYPFLFATPDGELEEIATGRKGGLEVKTTEIRNPRQWDDWKDRIPDAYFCQVCHQMAATGWEFVWLAAHIKWYTKDGDFRIDTREYYIERQKYEADIQYTMTEGIKFWQQVERRERPNLILPYI